ncbi:MAG: hypothetical protein GJU76_02380, partial [Gallionella sp.]|nr:hypothetical protein [Gallionella sp.]
MTQDWIDQYEQPNSRLSCFGARPARTSSTICCLNSGVYRLPHFDLDLAILGPSSRNSEVSTKAGQLQVGPDGERLRNGIKHVIVTQLPFAPPDGALSQGYARHLMRRGISPLTAGRIVFGKALSRALIKLLQAFGRGIRHPEDSFTFGVLDPRFPRSPRLRKAFSAST